MRDIQLKLDCAQYLQFSGHAPVLTVSSVQHWTCAITIASQRDSAQPEGQQQGNLHPAKNCGSNSTCAVVLQVLRTTHMSNARGVFWELGRGSEQVIQCRACMQGCSLKHLPADLMGKSRMVREEEDGRLGLCQPCTLNFGQPNSRFHGMLGLHASDPGCYAGKCSG